MSPSGIPVALSSVVRPSCRQHGRFYERHCRLARELAEEHFDARKVVEGVLKRALA
jgi:hypothetical protein